MHYHSGEEAIVTDHHTETFLERGPVMARGLPFVEIVDHLLVERQEGELHLFCLLHHAYAPIDISREPVAELIWGTLSDIQPCIESLMTHQHTMTEGTPCEFVGHGEVTRSEVVAISVNDTRTSIEHRWPTVFLYAKSLHLGSHMSQGVGVREIVASIEEKYIVARSLEQPLVHRIIETVIRFTHHHHLVPVGQGIGDLLIGLSHLHRAIRRVAVDDIMVYVGIRLCQYTV